MLSTYFIALISTPWLPPKIYIFIYKYMYLYLNITYTFVYKYMPHNVPQSAYMGELKIVKLQLR